MGDFEDIFGAGTDIEDIIDNISLQVSSENENKLVEHQLWFPDFAAAEAWEKAHQGTAFKRRPHLGGFEVTLTDCSSSAEIWQLSSMSEETFEAVNSGQASIVFAEELSQKIITHGTFSISLAYATDFVLDRLLLRLRNEVPFGRRHLSPIHLSKKRLRLILNKMHNRLAYDLELGRGVFAIYSEDHCLLVGRNTSKHEVAIWPWTLYIKNCGGGKFNSDGDESCFLCDHFGFDKSDSNHLFREFNNTPSYRELNNIHSHAKHNYIDSKLYAGKITRSDLAQCVKEWIGLLSPFDLLMDYFRRPPSDVDFVKDEDYVKHIRLNRICYALACVISIQNKRDVEVKLHCPTSLNGWGDAFYVQVAQWDSGKLKFHLEASRGIEKSYIQNSLDSNKYGLNFEFEDLDPFVDDDFPQFFGSDIFDIDFTMGIPKWNDVVHVYSKYQAPSSKNSGHGYEIARGNFQLCTLNPSQKIAATWFASNFHKNDLAPEIRDFLAAAKREIEELDNE